MSSSPGSEKRPNVNTTDGRNPWFYDPVVYLHAPVFEWTDPGGFNDGERTFLPAGGRRYDPVAVPGQYGNWTHVAAIAQSADRRPAKHDARLQSVLAVAGRILRRGVAPPVSRFLNTRMSDAVFLSERVGKGQPRWSSPDGSDLETQFVQRLAGLIEPREVLFFLHFQVPFGMLVPDAPTDARRVDFALIHPSIYPRVVVIELDGVHHTADSRHVLTDAKRDELLRTAGHTIIRLRAEELRSGAGSGLQQIAEEVRRCKFPRNWDEEATAIAHAQAGLLLAMAQGMLQPEDESWEVVCTGPWARTMSFAVQEFVQTLGALGELYGAQAVPETYVVSDRAPDGGHRGQSLELRWEPLPWFYPARGSTSDAAEVQRLDLRPVWLPVISPLPTPPAEWVQPDSTVSRETLIHLLRVVFPEKDAFRQGQEEAIRRSLAGQDSVVLLPTGAGKSLIFQLTAALTPGLALAVVPLVSLMEDQMDNLHYAGFDRTVSISSSTTAAGLSSAIEDRLKSGVFLICYIAPERLQIQRFRDSLGTLKLAAPVPQVVVDEAH
ncbi:MAG: DEAD/DEAH box helicase, partial [Chloroflexota bacterium]